MLFRGENMFNKIIELIDKYDKIIIHRHYNPDGDAYGSQMGLKRMLELTFKEKEIYAVGDVNTFSYLGDVDDIEDSVFEGALCIIVDVSVERLVSDKRFKLADHVLVIDHHLNPSDIADTLYNDSDTIACAQIVAEIGIDNNWIIDDIAATRMLTGIVTDSGRFVYPKTSAKTFEVAAHLISKGVNLDLIYERLYTETLEFKKLKGYFINNFKLTKNKVAYMKNDINVKDDFNVTTFTVSRAMVNQMSGIRGVDIWANFTETEDNEILCELRSKRDSIVHIARKYGGGGHALACGCTLNSFEEADLLLSDLDEFIESCEKNG
jgi:phosphoesterase RecJ-like protein